MGLAQGLESIIEAVRLLRDLDDILFVFVGHGAAKEGLVSMCRDMRWKM